MKIALTKQKKYWISKVKYNTIEYIYTIDSTIVAIKHIFYFKLITDDRRNIISQLLKYLFSLQYN